MLVVNNTDLLRNFPDAHATVADTLDARFADSNATSFIPVLRASSTNPDLGTDGFIEGKYITVLDMVICWGSWTFGSGMSAGSGTYFIELPIPIRFGANKRMFSSGIAANGMIVGTAFAILNRPRQATCQVRLISTPPNPSQLQFDSIDHAGVGVHVWADDSPFGWSAGSQANWNACYLRDEL